MTKLSHSDLFTKTRFLIIIYSELHLTLSSRSNSFIVCVLGLTKVKGVLLYGSTGTGKTLLMNELSQKLSKNIISVGNAGTEEILHSLDQIITKTASNGPYIITIDDLDSICREKSHSENDNKNILALSNLFDRIHNNNISVFVIATCCNISQVGKCF